MTKIKRYDLSETFQHPEIAEKENGDYYKVTDIDPILDEKQAIIDRVCEWQFEKNMPILLSGFKTSCGEIKYPKENYCPNCGGKIIELL